MRHILNIFILALTISMLSIGTTFGAVLTDADMPALKDALKKAYTPELCKKDLPNASDETCDCLRNAMAENLNTEKLKQCKESGYDECVAAEFTAAKTSLTEKQINTCKALSKEGSTSNKVEESDTDTDEAQ